MLSGREMMVGSRGVTSLSLTTRQVVSLYVALGQFLNYLPSKQE